MEVVQSAHCIQKQTQEGGDFLMQNELIEKIGSLLLEEGLITLSEKIRLLELLK